MKYLSWRSANADLESIGLDRGDGSNTERAADRTGKGSYLCPYGLMLWGYVANLCFVFCSRCDGMRRIPDHVIRNLLDIDLELGVRSRQQTRV